MSAAHDSEQHECPAPDCYLMVETGILACRRHWYSIPKDLRDELWRTWRQGTTVEYVNARDACVAFLAGAAAR